VPFKRRLGKEDIKKILPYRDPFLFADEVTKLTKNEIVGLKGITGKEKYFKGHFTNYPLMPGVLLIETAAQIGSILVRNNLRNHKQYLVLLHKLDNILFMRPVFPSAIILVRARILERTKNTFKIHAEVESANLPVAEMDMLGFVIKRTEFTKKHGQG
jgi:3-hydroxyacyl-[acyl-carrier-protein] dehydratase